MHLTAVLLMTLKASVALLIFAVGLDSRPGLQRSK